MKILTCLFLIYAAFHFSAAQFRITDSKLQEWQTQFQQIVNTLNQIPLPSKVILGEGNRYCESLSISQYTPPTVQLSRVDDKTMDIRITGGHVSGQAYCNYFWKKVLFLSLTFKGHVTAEVNNVNINLRATIPDANNPQFQLPGCSMQVDFRVIDISGNNLFTDLVSLFKGTVAEKGRDMLQNFGCTKLQSSIDRVNTELQSLLQG